MVDLELPSWLDAAFLATALQGEGDGVLQVTVMKFSTTLAVAAGDNYMSRVYRIKVDYVMDDEEKCTSLIIKAPFTKGAINDMFDESELYGKEPAVYNKLLPTMNFIAKFQFGPTCYNNSIKNILILADLKEQGYEMCDRYKQLDFAHCVYVFKSIAKFHAASVVCQKHNPELIQQVGKEVFYSDGERFDKSFRPWLKILFQHVAGIVKEMQISDVLVDLISSKAETIASSLLRLCKPKDSGLNVLNHGDLWVNNVLFKHSSSGDIVDIKFIDFQIAKYTSPVLDLLYLIWTSANEDVRESRLQELCEIYRLTLNTELEQLGCKERMTSEELHEDMKDAVDWALVSICNMLPVIVCDAADVINVEEIELTDIEGGIDDRYLKNLNGRRYRAMLPKVMMHFLSWIEYYT